MTLNSLVFRRDQTERSKKSETEKEIVRISMMIDEFSVFVRFILAAIFTVFAAVAFIV